MNDDTFVWQTECRNIYPQCFHDSLAMVPQERSNLLVTKSTIVRPVLYGFVVERRISHLDKHAFLLALSLSNCEQRLLASSRLYVRPTGRLSVCSYGKNMAPNGRTFVEFYTCEFLLRSVKKIQFWLNLTDIRDTRLMKIYDISPFFFLGLKRASKTLCRKSKCIFFFW